jgi:hypothetical protein
MADPPFLTLFATIQKSIHILELVVGKSGQTANFRI